MEHQLIIVTGAPGSGKTHYAKRLAKETGATLLDIDTTTETLVKASLGAMDKDPDDRDSPFFKEHFRQPIYDTLFAIAAENLIHTSVIITGPFTSKIKDSTWLDRLKARFAHQVEVHYTYCTPEVRKTRIQQRANPRDTSKLADWDNHIKYYGVETSPQFPHTQINTSQ